MENLVAGLIAAALGLVGVWLGQRMSHQRWLKDRQVDAAAQFIVASGHLYKRFKDAGQDAVSAEEKLEWRNRMREARWSLELLCGRRVRDLLEEMVDDLGRIDKGWEGYASDAETPLDRLVAALRAEIRTD